MNTPSVVAIGVAVGFVMGYLAGAYARPAIALAVRRGGSGSKPCDNNDARLDAAAQVLSGDD